MGLQLGIIRLTVIQVQGLNFTKSLRPLPAFWGFGLYALRPQSTLGHSLSCHWCICHFVQWPAWAQLKTKQNTTPDKNKTKHPDLVRYVCQLHRLWPKHELEDKHTSKQSPTYVDFEKLHSWWYKLESPF